MMKRILGLSLLSLMMACGAAATKEINRNGNDNVLGMGQGNGSICGDTSQDVSQNPRLIPIQQLSGSNYKMCDIMKSHHSSGGKATIFQFTSSDCLGCRDEAREITDFINNNNLSAQVKHYVVFVDNTPQTAATIASFMSTYAPIGMQMDDLNGASAEKLYGPGDIEFPLAMIINNNGDFRVKKYSDKSQTVTGITQSLVSSAK